jgi:hypothetical protein
MDYRKQITADPSRANVDYIVHSIREDKKLFEKFFPLIYDDNGYVANRAAWVLEKYAANYPHIVKPYLPEIIDQLLVTRFHGARRLLLKVVSFYPIPEEKEGVLVDRCFTWLESPKEKVALKVYSMQVLADFAQKMPDVIPELIAVLENNYEHNSIAFKSRASKTMKLLAKTNKNI